MIRREIAKIMKIIRILMIVKIVLCLLLIGGGLFAHRRVIKALINHEPMPKAPSWHFWVKKENRKD